MFKPEDFTYFDAHVHLYPERLFRAVRQWFATNSSWKIDYTTETDKIVQFLTEAQVERFFFFNYAHKAEMAASLNAWNYEVACRYPQAIALGTVHAADSELLGIANRCISEYGFPGFKIHTEVQRFSPDDERLFGFYEMVIENRAFVLMHVGTAPWANEHCGVDKFKKLMQRYPDLKIVIAHMGLFESEKFFELLDIYPSMRFDTAMAFGPMAELHHNWNPEEIAKHVDRILYGTDFPNLPYDYNQERLGLLNLELSKKDYQKIFYQNALSLLQSTKFFSKSENI